MQPVTVLNVHAQRAHVHLWLAHICEVASVTAWKKIHLSWYFKNFTCSPFFLSSVSYLEQLFAMSSKMHKSSNPRLVPQTFCAPSISAMPGMFNRTFQLLLNHYYVLSTGKKAQRSSAQLNTYRSIPLQRIQVPILNLTPSPVRAKTMMLARMNMPTAPLKGVALQNISHGG